MLPAWELIYHLLSSLWVVAKWAFWAPAIFSLYSTLEGYSRVLNSAVRTNRFEICGRLTTEGVGSRESTADFGTSDLLVVWGRESSGSSFDSKCNFYSCMTPYSDKITNSKLLLIALDPREIWLTIFDRVKYLKIGGSVPFDDLTSGNLVFTDKMRSWK